MVEILAFWRGLSGSNFNTIQSFKLYTHIISTLVSNNINYDNDDIMILLNIVMIVVAVVVVVVVLVRTAVVVVVAVVIRIV